MDNKIKCCQFFECTRSDCPAHAAEDRCCWLIDNTRCHAGIKENFLAKVEVCLACPVFKHNMDQTVMATSCAHLARQFADARRMLNERDSELEAVSMEMALGLSEVFEALKKIATGDPQVRIDESSSLELIVKLKQLVNATAAQMGEMVDLAHEFAMGLAEHFDVLHRVAKGDLDARVEGSSAIELLDSLKTVTNRMIASVKTEIHHRRQITRNLKESEARFRAFAEHAPVGITIMNADQTFAFINQAFTEIFGYTIRDIPDKATWFKTAYPDPAYRETVIGDWEQSCAAGGMVPVEPRSYAVRCKDGTNRTTIFRSVLMEDGKHFVTYLDVTREAMAQSVLKESEEKYRTLIDNIQDGVILIERNRLLFVNEAMGRIVGYPPGELIGMDYREFIAPEDRDLVLERYHRRQAGEAVPQNYEFHLLHKDGRTRRCVNLNVGVINFRNRVVSIGTIKDITERKQAERERREMAEKLQRSQKMEAIGTLAGGVAHDLNNILSGIVSYPELLLMDLSPESPMYAPIMTIQKSGQRAAAIVQDLLTLARRGVATKETIHLNRIVDDFLVSPEFDRLRAFHPRMRVTLRLADDLLPLTGSPVHLQKTIMNLVSNAAEAMPAGGEITITTENRYLERPVKLYDDIIDGEWVIFEVGDTGVGISPHDIEQIFEPFYTKKVMGRSGTGLGMAVVWGTVKDHHGHINVRSIEGQGTTLTLYFPISRDQRPAPAKATDLDSIRGHGERILVVDDVPEQCEIAQAILSRLGYRVIAVASGEAAVEYLRTQEADLMILDMIMDPGIDGLETFRQVKSLHPGQRVVIASGFSETDRVKTLRAMGVTEYLKKPYTIEKIGLSVKRGLGG